MKTGVEAKIAVSAAFEVKDKDGNIMKVIHMTGAVPLSKLGLTEEQAVEMIEKEQENGTDNR